MSESMYNMRMKIRNIWLAIFCVFLLQGFSFAPKVILTIDDIFYSRLKGSSAQKLRAVAGFKYWPRYYGLRKKTIFYIIEKESNFDCNAFNPQKGEIGLMQPWGKCFQDISFGAEYFNKDGSLNKHKVFDPWENIRIGCAYYKICKRKAKHQNVGRFQFKKDEIALFYYNGGIGTWEKGFKKLLLYAQNINEKGGEEE